MERQLELAGLDGITVYSRRIASGSASEEAMGFVQMLREQSTIEVFEDRLQ